MGWVFFSTFGCDQLAKIHQHDEKKNAPETSKAPSFPDCAKFPRLLLTVTLCSTDRLLKKA